MLNERLVAELVRHRLGEIDASKSGRTILLIPEALKAVARKVAADHFIRHKLLTNKSTTVLPISDAFSVDLSEGYKLFRFLLEYIDVGQIYHESSDFPLQKLSINRARLQPPPQTGFVYYYIEGNTLVVLSEAAGNLSFAVPSYPANVSQLPEELEKMLIDKIVEMVTMSDASEDGEK
ncbi:MAG TPA: hypothetical protein VNI84_01370 [Pyrinomonadaceae bacterium]|nr:hypothetical protein [Pyrinomonadaceae bacterium]